MSDSNNSEDLQYLDTEFNMYLQIARNYMKQMRLAEDRRSTEKYIRSCLNMKNNEQVKIKALRNRFFRYLLKTMKRTVESQGSVFVNMSQNISLDEETPNEVKQWSPDQKSYISAKIIPGFGTLVYMACTDNPDLGWDDKGFSNFVSVSPTTGTAI